MIFSPPAQHHRPKCAELLAAPYLGHGRAVEITDRKPNLPIGAASGDATVGADRKVEKWLRADLLVGACRLPHDAESGRGRLSADMEFRPSVTAVLKEDRVGNLAERREKETFLLVSQALLHRLHVNLDVAAPGVQVGNVVDVPGKVDGDARRSLEPVS